MQCSTRQLSSCSEASTTYYHSGRATKRTEKCNMIVWIRFDGENEERRPAKRTWSLFISLRTESFSGSSAFEIASPRDDIDDRWIDQWKPSGSQSQELKLLRVRLVTIAYKSTMKPWIIWYTPKLFLLKYQHILYRYKYSTDCVFLSSQTLGHHSYYRCLVVHLVLAWVEILPRLQVSALNS